MGPDLGPTNLRRYKFVLRFDSTNRKPLPPKSLGIIQDLQNEFTDFEEFKVAHPENPKTIFDPTWLNHPVFGITLQLTALRVM